MQLMVMLALMLGMFIFATVLTLLLKGIFGMSGTSFILWAQAITQVLVFLVPVVLMTIIYYKDSARDYYRLRFGRREWMMALAAAVVTLLLVPANDWLATWNDGWNLGLVGEKLRELQNQTEGMVEQMLSADTVGGLLANLVVVALMPAVCEEVFFRAGIQNLLQRWFRNPHVAIWLAAIIFSLGHGELFSFMPRFVLGALLGYLYVYGGSILVNSAAHFTNNALVVLMYWLSARGVLPLDPSEPLTVGWLLTACCTLAAVGVLWVTFFGKKLKNSTV